MLSQERLSRIFRFGISGALAVGSLVGLLYLFTDIFHIWYLASATLAFVIAVVLSFLLQKFWAFRDGRRDVLAFQARWYVAIQLWDLGLNTLFLYLLVDKVHVYYLFAQAGVSIAIAIQNFILYTFLFTQSSTTGGTSRH